MLTQIFIGILIIALGSLMVYKTVWFIQMIGRIAWAERTFGGGGTRLFFKLLGLIFVVIGIIIATDLSERIFGSIFIKLFGF